MQRTLPLFLIVGLAAGLTGCDRAGSPLSSLGMARPRVATAAPSPPQDTPPADTASAVPYYSQYQPSAPLRPASGRTGSTSFVPKVAPEPGTPVPNRVPRPRVTVESVAAASTSAAAKPTLDLDTLENRLRETDAIGVMTKLAVKNQVDDLIEAFATYHKGDKSVPLPQLRDRFNLLLMKVASLVQDGDPKLFTDISGARDGLWQMLSDPQNFARL